LISTPAAPTLIDMRIDEDVFVDLRPIPGAVRRSQLDTKDWASGLTGQSVVVVCQEGKKLSEGTAAWLRCGKVPPEILGHGHVSWKEANHSTGPATEIPGATTPAHSTSIRDGVGTVPKLKDDRPEAIVVLLQGNRISTVSVQLD
jgi:hypothetical protein